MPERNRSLAKANSPERNPERHSANRLARLVILFRELSRQVWTKTTKEPEFRAQTSMDFVIGVSIFLVTVGVVFGMIPSLIDPFEEASDDSITADRIASQLIDGMLTDPARHGVLDESCTYAFFDEAHGDGGQCAIRFNESESTLARRLNVSASYSLNVTIQRDIDGDQSKEILCTDGSQLAACSGGGTTQLAAGAMPPTHQSTFAARRTAYLDNKDITLVVTIW